MTPKFWIMGAGLLLAGCASFDMAKPGTSSDSKITVVNSSELPPPSGVDTSSLERPYRIGPFDKLKIDVYGAAELSKVEVQTDASGRISFPLVGSLDAAGKTPAELAAAIEGGLDRYIREPQVTVNLEETVSQVITVDGEVKEPGQYPVIGRMTLMRAIARAKGATELAKLDQVAVFRNVGGSQMAAVYSLKSIREGRYADPEVFADDVVVVGDSQSRRLLKDVLTIAPLVTTPLILLLQR